MYSLGQVYHIFSIKDNILDNRIFLKDIYFHKESIEWKELEQDRLFPFDTDSSYFACRGDNDMTMHCEVEVGENVSSQFFGERKTSHLVEAVLF